MLPIYEKNTSKQEAEPSGNNLLSDTGRKYRFFEIPLSNVWLWTASTLSMLVSIKTTLQASVNMF